MVTLLLIIIFVLLIGFGIAFYFMYRYHEYQLKREIKRAQKSELLKSVFLDNISRALRAPLNAILGYSNLILEEKHQQSSGTRFYPASDGTVKVRRHHARLYLHRG